ncbi:hypothetical protein EPA93_16780 [Ktedonosporobacter rubrisoli]|uniref:Uncharacterized protein n=1 Tax=Ktedonosporobacter rubrisoli TaxID=2509675 RepID=A0A4P6JQF1_KTERU|nr:hypothetical protein [Ktedonosporobacter rubrisoli]QBD77555.1 hypothetical protein EPA93_16780 [Ktedonosporobacter rubrisoli]
MKECLHVKQRKRPAPAGKPRRDRDDEHFAVRHIFQALTDLPRVMGLIWSSSRWMTSTMVLVSLISGVVAAVSVWITRGVVDSVIVVAFSPSHPLGPVWFFVVAQLVVGLGRACSAP